MLTLSTTFSTGFNTSITIMYVSILIYPTRASLCTGMNAWYLAPLWKSYCHRRTAWTIVGKYWW
jgi:hypothetical protein